MKVKDGKTTREYMMITSISMASSGADGSCREKVQHGQIYYQDIRARKKKVRTIFNRKCEAAYDRINPRFMEEYPEQLWVAEFTYFSNLHGFS